MINEKISMMVWFVVGRFDFLDCFDILDLTFLMITKGRVHDLL